MGASSSPPLHPAAHSACLFQSSSFSSITDSTMSLNIITVTLNMGESAEHSQAPVLGKNAGSGKHRTHVLWFGVGSQGILQGSGFHVQCRKKEICSLCCGCASINID